MSRAASDPAGAVGAASEVALAAVHVVVALSFARVFDDSSYVGPLLAFVVVGHLAAALTRRVRAPLALTAAVAVAGAVVVAGIALFGSTTAFGMPTGDTWSAARLALSDARAAYPEVVAPTAALPGFLLAAGIALWAAAWFGDATAHRLRAGVEAITPGAAIFVFCAVLGSGQHARPSAIAFAATSLAYLALQRAANARRDQAWSPEARPATRTTLRGAAALGAVAVLAGALVGTHLPGAGSDAALDWRGEGQGQQARVTVSPMVELHRRLVEQSDLVVFHVRSDRPAYWRLTSLDRFDGAIWASDGEFRAAEDDLDHDREPTGATTVTQSFRIDALSAIWAPAAFEATSVDTTSVPLRWDRDSSTLIVDGDETTSDGLAYTVVSEVPTFDASQLQRADGPDPSRIERRYEGLPDDFPDLARDLASRETRGATSRYDQALALQRFFREQFTYSTDVVSGHGDDDLVAFLEDRVGYCEQFAGAYAAMARSLGIPARVAVGFTQGESDVSDPGTYIVRGRHAHAWPELYFSGIGWVPFEPTPGRGMPDAERYTGVEPAQDADVGSTGPTSTTPAETTSPTAAPTTSAATTDGDLTERDESLDQPPPSAASPRGAGHRSGLAVGLVVLVSVAITIAVARRRRRRARGGSTAGPAEQRWRRAVAALVERGVEPPAANETPLEVASRVRATAAHLHVDEAIGDLAELVDEERWSAGANGDDRATIEARAAALVSKIEGELELAQASSSASGSAPSRRSRPRTRSPLSPK